MTARQTFATMAVYPRRDGTHRARHSLLAHLGYSASLDSHASRLTPSSFFPFFFLSFLLLLTASASAFVPAATARGG